MPLSMVNAGEPFTIKRIGGKEEVKRHLEELGFVVGGVVTVVSEINGSLIVNVKESRVAIGKDMASKIMVWRIDCGNDFSDTLRGKKGKKLEDIKRSSCWRDR